MMVFLATIDMKGKVHEFSCMLNSIEADFDFVNSIVADGHTLLSLYLLENEKPTYLPLDAFTGTSVILNIQELQHEWEALLNVPTVVTLSHQQEMIMLTRQRIQQYEVRSEAHEQMIRCCKNWLLRTQEHFVLGSFRDSLLTKYTSMIISHQNQLVVTKLCSTLATDRLSRLLVA